MAKLVDLLAKYLVEWPDGAEYVGQCKSGFVYANADDFVIDFDLAEDWETAIVAKQQYLSARDRLHAETVKDMREPTNADTDQALWDKVALQTHEALFRTQDGKAMGFDERAEFSFNEADAFMAERAKRLAAKQ